MYSKVILQHVYTSSYVSPVRNSTSIYIYRCVCVYVHIYMHVLYYNNMCVYIYTYIYIWVVVKIMVHFWIPIIIRHLIFRVPKKGPQFWQPPIYIYIYMYRHIGIPGCSLFAAIPRVYLQKRDR